MPLQRGEKNGAYLTKKQTAEIRSINLHWISDLLSILYRKFWKQQEGMSRFWASSKNQNPLFIMRLYKMIYCNLINNIFCINICPLYN